MSISSNVDQNSFKNLSLYLITFVSFLYLISILSNGNTLNSLKEIKKIGNYNNYQSELQEIWNDYNFQRSKKRLKFLNKTEISYEKIDDFFIKLLKLRKSEIKMEMLAKNPVLFRRYKNLLENISPWKILDSDPNKTILPYVHVPKTAGSTFRDLLKKDGQSISKWPYSNQIFPNFKTNSWNSPGCRPPQSWGGTHCGFAELDSCLKNNYANLYGHNNIG